MPIYEYRCPTCRLRFSRLWLSVSQATSPECPKCAALAERIISRVARVRSEESRLEALADPRNFSDLDENDPQSVSRWAQKMGREMGDELGEDFSESLEETLAAESGEAAGGLDAGGDGL
jgi:putative FmdB family regulatory protein